MWDIFKEIKLKYVIESFMCEQILLFERDFYVFRFFGFYDFSKTIVILRIIRSCIEKSHSGLTIISKLTETRKKPEKIVKKTTTLYSVYTAKKDA